MGSHIFTLLHRLFVPVQIRSHRTFSRSHLYLIVVCVFCLQSFGGTSAVVAQTNSSPHDDATSLVEAGWDVTIRKGQLVGGRISYYGDDDALVRAPDGLVDLEIIHTDADKLLTFGAQRFAGKFPGVRDLTVEWDLPTGRAVTASDYETLLSLPRLRNLSIDRVVGPSLGQGHSEAPAEIESLSIGLGEGVTVAELIRNLPLKELHVTISDKYQTSGMVSAIAENLRLEHLDIAVAHSSPMQRLDLSPLAELPRLESLKFQNVEMDPSQFHQLHHLKTLHLCNCRFSSPGDEVLQHPTLERIVFEVQSCDKLGLRHPMTRVGKSLKRIELWLPDLHDLALFTDANCALTVALGTQSPSVANCYDIGQFRDRHVVTHFGPAEIRALAAFNGLRELRFTGGFCTGYVDLSETAINEIVDATSLTSLTGVAVHRDAGAFAQQETATPTLRELSLILDPPLSFECFSMLVGNNLQVLSAELPEIPTKLDWEQRRPDCPNLESLGLKSPFGGELGSKLAMSLYSPRLRQLRVVDADIGIGAIEEIVSRCPGLEALELKSCQFESAEDILKLNQLEHLNEVSVLDCDVAPSIIFRLNTNVIRIGHRDIRELGNL